MSTLRYRRYDTVYLGAIGIIGALLVWELAARLRLADPVLISSPMLVAGALRGWAVSGALWRDLGTTLYELVIAIGASALVGIPLGVIMGWNRPAEYALDPFIWLLYSTPLVSFWPLFIIWLGIGANAIIALAFLFSIVQIVINTMVGVKGIDPVLVRCARSFNARAVDLFFKVTLPGALPMIVAGLRLALGRALIGVIVGELFSSNAGLGFHISFYGTRLQFADVFAGLFVIVIVGVGMSQAIRLLESRLVRWKS
ncbi:MAG: ABC transporter permease [Thermodesulfobacteriota bacterium]|nr:ABC transporter permease [Thermodesulfobacteriota bacterium]